MARLVFSMEASIYWLEWQASVLGTALIECEHLRGGPSRRYHSR